MNFNLFLITLIALIIIFIILYNGLRIKLTLAKENSMANYEFKVTLLKIAIFKREGKKGLPDFFKDEEDEENSEEDPAEDWEDNEEESEDEKSIREKYNELKPLLKSIKNSKDELKTYLKNILNSIDIKRLEGHFMLGLSDHATTVKIASVIWSIGAIANSNKSRELTVEPIFTKRAIDFEGKVEMKINLILLIAYTIIILSERNIRDLIRELYDYLREEDEEESAESPDYEDKVKNNEEN